ncbi:unnamed protein product [Periconia digitata]|uniref:Uncharacterized protein n=1 Tax=Periconia digitata TaxID=1303443 RepID=A0A9W4U6A4_9PLEO|nr:unnamed protein product [Periconia digitata]
MLRSDIPANDPFWDVDPHHPAITMPTRWQFCLFVDDNCLRSLDHPDLIMGPYVKILTTDWKGDRTTTTAEGWEDGETDNEHEDVGWMYMEAIDCIEMYRNLIDPSSWTDPYYSRPYKGFIP